MNRNHLMCGLALMAGLATTSCVDLGEKLVGTVTTQYFSTPAGLDAAVNGGYAQLQGFWGREESMAITEFGMDLMTAGDQPAYTFLTTYAAGLNASIDQVRFPWNSFYRGINTSNAVIERAPIVTGMDPVVKATRIAEAKFLRALSFFYLVEIYGPIPIPTAEAQGASTEAHRSPVDSVYLQIVKDLREAIPDLPIAAANPGRATRGAARHLLAKVLLTRAYRPRAYEVAPFYITTSGSFVREAGATAATDFAQARAEADTVISNIGGGAYTLVANYVDLFCAPMGARGPGGFCSTGTGFNEANTENIFSVQFTITAGQFTTGSGNSYFVDYLSFYDDRQGLARDCDNGRAFRRARPTLYARNLWQRWVDSTHTTTLDTRYDGTFQSVWYSNATNAGACTQTQGAARMAAYTTGTCASGGLPSFGTLCTNGAAFVLGDTAVFQPGFLVGQAYRQSHKYAVYEPCNAEPCPIQTNTGIYDNFRYPTLKKFQDNQRPDFNNLDGGRDFILMRLGETYLIAAEAALGMGDQAGARAYVVFLRQRAASGATNKTMIVDAAHMPATVDLNYILDERGRELNGEMMRWFDLARTGLWTRITQYNTQSTFFSEPKHHLRPIPQTQIDLTSTPFPQNTGY